ncbi:cysteine desulfurase family protein [Thermococcus sp. SY098]|uniref:cysteine desulfurase family protein n=1 Tax=Thermococcus sp. SY098 TaxID=3111325 RepID=UPI002D783193|nr:cysteine desulfurase family protein [Thermococcus sp. SY098]WRS53013.1 cysteine desulfurase family protein [Thermococcus sp. SY098]
MVIYLDNANTTKPDPEVIKVMLEYFEKKYGTPGGEFGHVFDEESREAVEKAREIIAREINASPEEIIFVSDETEADNLAIKGIAWAKSKGKVLASKIERKAILNTIKRLGEWGFETYEVSVDREGFINLDDLQGNLKDAILLATHLGNFEIGTIQDIKAISEIVHDKGALFYLDANHAFGKVKIDVKKLDVDLMSITAHLIHGPKGIAALYIRDGVKLKPLLDGDVRERGIRPGMINVPAIAGFGKAVELINYDDAKRMAKLRDKLIDLLLGIPDTKLNGPRGEKRLPNNVNVSFAYVEGESILLHCDLRGLVFSTGSACYSQELLPSHVIRAIGGSFEDAHGSVRLSLSKWTTEEEIVKAYEIIKDVVEKLREISIYGGKR